MQMFFNIVGIVSFIMTALLIVAIAIGCVIYIAKTILKQKQKKHKPIIVQRDRQ